jgi:hypothetical protein
MVNRRRTGSARRTANDPANAAFIGSVLLLAAIVAMSIGRHYRRKRTFQELIAQGCEPL